MTEIKELTRLIDELMFASDKAESILKQFDNIKSLEIDIKEATINMSKIMDEFSKILKEHIEKNLEKETKEILGASKELKLLSSNINEGVSFMRKQYSNFGELEAKSTISIALGVSAFSFVVGFFIAKLL